MATLRSLWNRGEPTIGGWIGFPGPLIVEVLGKAGFDWLCIDLQHGVIGYEALVPMLEVAATSGIPCFVRVSWNNPSDIMRALDAGAQGVIVPMIDSADEARDAVAACRYPPDGYRSWGYSRGLFGTEPYTPAVGNESVVCALMIETAGGLQSLPEIVAVPGVDAVFVGPSDLGLTHGLGPLATGWGPEHGRLVESIAATCQASNVVAGIACPDAEWAATWRAVGYSMLAVGSDAVFMLSAARAAVARLAPA